jgi:hypothetical protein
MKEGKFSASFEGKSYRIGFDLESIQSTNVISIYLDDAPLIKIAGTHFHILQPAAMTGDMSWGINVGTPKEQELKATIAQALEAHIRSQTGVSAVQH